MPKDILVKEEFKEPQENLNINNPVNNQQPTYNQQVSNVQGVYSQQPMNYQNIQRPVVPNINQTQNQIQNVQQPMTFQSMTNQMNNNVSQ